ncbi:MAG: META domain-containing protein [Anaerolineales bacterium]|jgi:heat shock protein HslJ
MKIRKRIQLALITILLVVSLLGCSAKSGELAVTEWELISLNGRSLIQDTAITLNFHDEYLGGEMGCNGYGGTPDTGKYSAKSDGSFSLVGLIAVTVQLCREPEGIMEQEAEYIEALNRVSRFQKEGDRLTFFDETGKRILVFVEK